MLWGMEVHPPCVLDDREHAADNQNPAVPNTTSIPPHPTLPTALPPTPALVSPTTPCSSWGVTGADRKWRRMRGTCCLAALGWHSLSLPLPPQPALVPALNPQHLFLHLPSYLREFPIERYMRDLRVHTILEGTNEIMRVIIHRWVGGWAVWGPVPTCVSGRAGTR